MLPENFEICGMHPEQFVKLSNVLYNTVSVPFENHLFSGGEWQIWFGINGIDPFADTLIEINMTTSLDIMKLLVTTDALRRINPNMKISVCMPYLPYSRQDRVMRPGEALSIKVMADLINSQHYDTVYVLDPHSDVSLALINNLSLINVDYMYKEIIDFQSRDGDVTLVAPDAGAMKKTMKIAQNNRVLSVVYGHKIRNVTTGDITGTSIVGPNGSVEGKVCVMVDDVCDGGRTFVELAKCLKLEGAKKIVLIVSHGIFSKGFRPFVGLIDMIYSLNSPWAVAPEGTVETEYFTKHFKTKCLSAANLI